MLINQSVIADLRAIIHNAKYKAIRLVDLELALTYRQIGQRIFEEEQQGKAVQVMVIILLNLLPPG